MIMNYKFKPRNDLLLVKRAEIDERKIGGIIIPVNHSKNPLSRFEVLKVGSNVTDIKEGDFVLGEDMFQKIDSLNEEIGLLNQKFAHVIEE